MSHVQAGIAVYDPRPGEMRLRASEDGSSLFLTLADDRVWFALAGAGADLAAEAAAMDRLAVLAAESAATIRARLAEAGEGR
ncbi:hypothetical protein AB0F17_17030 [Nonomuraea sp. NPDC026600]|uniref:hypothetical protein n=1 Tax=Nonomuraea sp. NPDC026600 TaxID=3155363 RepID=UPI00340DD3FD